MLMSDHRFFAVAIVILLFSCVSFGQENTPFVSLSGQWAFELDKADKGIEEAWFNRPLRERITLPGSTDEAGFGEKTTGSDYGVLTRVHKYIGPAWYQKTIMIPPDWEGKTITLFLERVLWESRIWLDGQEISTQDSLATPHIHTLGKLTPGEHRLSIRINNDLIHNIGDKGHAYTEYLQTIWNGIVGRIELQAQDPIHFTTLRLFPDIQENTVRLEMKTNADVSAELAIQFRNAEGQNVIEHNQQVAFTKGVAEITLDASKLERWSEFNPVVYQVAVSLQVKGSFDVIKSSYGHRQVSHNGRHILINNQAAFMRGNLDCVHFPLTGYPATSVAEWKRIFAIYKDYGLNHVRFHSWSPPKAAFDAADELGIYIQSEASVWLDWWMAVDNKGRPEMNTKGKPKGLGPDNPNGSAFVQAEIDRVIETYGNHPSFVFFAIGNELGNSDFEVMGEWIKTAKEKDPRRLYAASTARKVTPYDDYAATHHYPGIGSVRQTMTNGTDWDYEAQYSQTPIPVIAHEIGQWPVYPEWREIDKYTGVVRARNLQGFKAVARKNGIVDQDRALRQASGALNILLYKDEMESFLRTPGAAGVQLLSMQDYSGQGEALIGWLDSFYDSKGLATAADIRRFINTTVPLLRLPKYVYTDTESLKAQVQVHHFGEHQLSEQKIIWALKTPLGETLKQGNLGRHTLKVGTLSDIASLDIALKDLPTAAEYAIEVSLSGTEFSNSWPLWVFPSRQEADMPGDVIVSEKFDQPTRDALQAGKKVLLLAHRSGQPENSRYAAWKPLYWSASFFPGQSIDTLGLLIQHRHPAFADFPTDNHSNWQWWNIYAGARGFVLDAMPADYKPIAQPVSDFHYNHKLGSIFEVAVGKGRLLVSGYDLSNKRMSLPEVRQLRHSLMRYMQSDAFNPTHQVELSYLDTLFPYYAVLPSQVPDGFEQSILYANAGQPKDKVIIQKGVNYSVRGEVNSKASDEYAWKGQDLHIELEVPQGILADFYVRFKRQKAESGRGAITFEGRTYSIDPYEDKSKWVKLHVMREDSNDGQLRFSVRSVSVPGAFWRDPLRIDTIALIPKH